MSTTLAPRIITGFRDATTAIRSRTIAYAGRQWTGMDAWRDADVERFAANVVPVVTGAQAQVAAMTDAYLATLQTVVLGRPARAVGIPAQVFARVRGVDPMEVYQRPAVSMRMSLAAGDSLTTAVGRGLDRLSSLVATDLQLAKTHSAQHVAKTSTTVVGWRRELEGDLSCGLCIVASTQRYHKEDLMPIHPGCDCQPVPIYGSEDPGTLLDAGTLDDVHASIAERFGASDAGGRDPVDYRKALIVHEHGEIGPVLAVRDHAFTSEDDLD